MNIINSYTSWQPLEEVIVGCAYTPDYFDFIENAQVRNQLQQHHEVKHLRIRRRIDRTYRTAK